LKLARRKQSVTIKHVAADAGVSLQTVSRVINNEPNVREEMKRRVQESIAKLGYVPSIAARRMSGSKSYIILALSDRDQTISVWKERDGSDWVDQMLLGGMLRCAEFGYRMIFELVDTRAEYVERELRSALVALQPDGVILLPPHNDNALICDILEQENIAFARVGSDDPGRGICLTMDDEGSSEMATQYLLDLGHRHIGFITGGEHYSLSARRTEGWLRTMAAAGIDPIPYLQAGNFGYESGLTAARNLLDGPTPITAILASSGQMALACMHVAEERGLKVPEQLSVISFDNAPVVHFTQPQLTAIDQAIAPTIASAVDHIIAATRGEARPKQAVHLPAKLVIRGSTAAPRQIVSG
jgi:LacI family transcriptional regulator